MVFSQGMGKAEQALRKWQVVGAENKRGGPEAFASAGQVQEENT